MGIFAFIIIGLICVVAYVIYDNVSQKEKRGNIESKLKSLNEFNATEIYLQKNGLQGISFDEENKKIAFVFQNTEFIYPFSKLIDCEIIRDNVVVFKSSKSGAIAGGLIAGGIGAIVGGGSGTEQTKVKSLALKLIFDDLREPVRNVQFYDSINEKGDSAFYYENDLRLMERWHGIFTAIISRNNRA